MNIRESIFYFLTFPQVQKTDTATEARRMRADIPRAVPPGFLLRSPQRKTIIGARYTNEWGGGIRKDFASHATLVRGRPSRQPRAKLQPKNMEVAVR